MDSNKKIYGYTQEQLTNIFNEYKNENDSIEVHALQKLLNQEFNKQIETSEDEHHRHRWQWNVRNRRIFCVYGREGKNRRR